MREPGHTILALDQGGHASRALVFDGTGSVVARAETAVATRRDGDRVEQNPEELASSLLDVARRATADAGPCHACGLATQRSSIVCWDRNTGQPLSPVLSWQDRRATDRLRPLEPRAEQVGQITGLRLSPHYGASKLAWCLAEIPAVHRARREGSLAAGPLASFLLARLLRERPCLADPANAARTLLYDRRAYDWSPEMLAMFGLPPAILPAAVPSRYRFGHLRLDGPDLPLTVCTGDQSAALFAAGMPGPGTVFINAGTGAFLQQAVTAPASPSRLLAGLAWHGTATTVHTIEATVNGAGAALSRAAREEDVSEDALFDGLPEALAANREPPLFLNGVGGLGSPYWQPRFTSRYVGRGDAPARFTAVVESIVFLVAVNLEEMATQRATPRRIVLTGGLAKLDGFARRLAAVSGLTVERPGYTEATARGLGWLVAGRPGNWQEPAWQRDEPAEDDALRRRYRRWRRAMEAAV